jgi:hypothetical protein
MPAPVISPFSRGSLTGLVEAKSASTARRTPRPAGIRASATVPLQRMAPTDESVGEVTGRKRADKLTGFKQRRTRMLSLMYLFRQQVEEHAEASQMTGVLRALISEARIAFDLAADVCRVDPRDPEDEARCIDSLAGLLRMLEFNQRPPFNELFHATDGLIVKSVRWGMMIDRPRGFRHEW